MDKTTKAFVIAACTVVIGGAEIWTYNWFQTKAEQDALTRCTDENYFALLDAGRFKSGQEAQNFLDSCGDVIDKKLNK